jgi:hypothetical protein
MGAMRLRLGGSRVFKRSQLSFVIHDDSPFSFARERSVCCFGLSKSRPGATEPGVDFWLSDAAIANTGFESSGSFGYTEWTFE